MKKAGYITTEQAAQMLHCSTRQVLRLAAKYNWPKQKFSGDRKTYWHKASVDIQRAQSLTKYDKIDKSKLLPFGWYGGKFVHLDWLLPLLPRCDSFVDVFGGSMSVLLNRDPAMSNLETYNDLDGDLVNFFRVLREDLPSLRDVLAVTLYSREEFLLSLQREKGLGQLERARRFFVRARMSFGGIAQTPSAGMWSFCKKERATGAHRYWNSIEGLQQIAERIHLVQIENDSWEKIISRYDTKDTLFYLDPPYCKESRKRFGQYGNELSDEDHEQLASVLGSIKGKFAISGYNCTLMEKLYGKYQRFDAKPSKNNICHSERQESLWANYELQKWDLFSDLY